MMEEEKKEEEKEEEGYSFIISLTEHNDNDNALTQQGTAMQDSTIK